MVRNILISLVISLFYGCAAMGHISTSDPREKLIQACGLLYAEVRPYPAKRIIKEAIEICKETNDTPCLAQAYLIFGSYNRAIDALPGILTQYKRWGREEKVAEYNNREKIAKKYFQKAEELANGNPELMEKIDLARNTAVNKLGKAAEKFCF
jgi:hypothetical protein